METISQKTAQQIVDTVKSICGFDINFINAEGIVLASTAPGRIGSFHEAGRRAILAGDTIEVKDDGLFYGARRGVNLPVFYHGAIIAAIGITGEVDAVRGYGALARRITDMLLRERDLYVQGSQRQSSLHYIIDSLAKGIPITQAWLDAFLEEYRIDRSDLYRTLVIRLDTRYTSPDPDFWNWKNIWSWAETSQKLTIPPYSEHRGCFGYLSAKMWGWQSPGRKSKTIGWRPILEPISEMMSQDMIGKLVLVKFNDIEISGCLIEFTDYDLILEFPVPVPNMEAGAIRLNNGFRWVLARDRVSYVVEKET